jgi:hypothetical protein
MIRLLCERVRLTEAGTQQVWVCVGKDLRVPVRVQLEMAGGWSQAGR